MALKKAMYQVEGQAKGTRGFENLEVYQMALDLMLNLHTVTKIFPPEEKYNLTAQTRRASKSISANIAEGYGRYHYLDSLRFYYIARGSLTETLNHLITAKLLDHIVQDQFQELYIFGRRTERALNGYINWVKTQRQGASEYGDNLMKEDGAEYITNMDWDIEQDAPDEGNSYDLD